MKYDVFISYSRKDIDEVSVLIETIRAKIPGLAESRLMMWEQRVRMNLEYTI